MGGHPVCLCVCASLVKWRQRNIPGPSGVFRGIPTGPPVSQVADCD